MDREERGRGGERHVDPGEHEAVPQVQEPHREEPGLHAHDLQVLFFFPSDALLCPESEHGARKREKLFEKGLRSIFLK